jgi:hypothetical protein
MRVFLPHSGHASKQARSDPVFKHKTAMIPDQSLDDGLSDKPRNKHIEREPTHAPRSPLNGLQLAAQALDFVAGEG